MRKILIVVLLFTFAACDSYNDDRGKGDAPVGDRIEEPRTVLVNVDGFPNLSVLCDGTTAIYTNTRQSGNTVTVANSEYCGGGENL